MYDDSYERKKRPASYKSNNLTRFCIFCQLSQSSPSSFGLLVWVSEQTCLLQQNFVRRSKAELLCCSFQLQKSPQKAFPILLRKYVRSLWWKGNNRGTGLCLSWRAFIKSLPIYHSVNKFAHGGPRKGEYHLPRVYLFRSENSKKEFMYLFSKFFAYNEEMGESLKKWPAIV